jgi:hypothetical protein
MQNGCELCEIPLFKDKRERERNFDGDWGLVLGIDS